MLMYKFRTEPIPKVCLHGFLLSVEDSTREGVTCLLILSPGTGSVFLGGWGNLSPFLHSLYKLKI